MPQSEFQEAIDTSSSCFVFASAGSGKTKVLVDRYVKLMLGGCAPQDILCITFTNAAATEMQARIASILEKLAINTDSFADKYLREIAYFGKKHDNPAGLFSEWIDGSARANITTIHSFCYGLLKNYPIEAGVDSDFEIMDDVDISENIEIAKNIYFEKISNHDNKHIEILSKLLTIYSFDEFIEKIFAEAPKLRRFFHFNNDVENYGNKLRQMFCAKNLYEIPEQYKNMEDVYLTASGTIRKNAKDIGIAKALYNHKQNKSKNKIINKTCLFLTVAQQIFNRYNEVKKEKNLLDFSDIIYKAMDLFKVVHVPFKHIMIDEAQDMSSDQWRIISLMGNEILSNHRDNTIFVVGDLKQSIYSFQDACPKSFVDFYQDCEKNAKFIHKRLKTVYLNKCYRTLPNILKVVDKVFSKEFENYKNHVSCRAKFEHEGIVELSETLPTDVINSEDVMILARSRSDFKNYGIDVPNSQVKLNDSLIILDVIAVAEFVISNNNDYALCCILKSPNIFRNPMNEEQIFDLCYKRNCTVFENLRKNKNYSEYTNYLESASRKSKSLFEFFYYIASNLVHRTEVVYQFLDILLKYIDKKKSNEILDFIVWLQKNDIKVNINRNDKMNTIHGSKGLEADNVILLDFCKTANKGKTKFIWRESMDDLIFFIKPTQKEMFDEAVPIIDMVYKEEELENMRLLYVAMTRARNKLYIIGKAADGGVFDLVRRCLD